MHNQPWIMLGPGGTCQSMRIPVKPKQSACARGRSLRGCYAASEQTAAYLVSRYHPRTLTDTVHFHSVCREHWNKRAPLTRQRYKAGRNRSRDLGGDGKTQGRTPQRHRHLSSEENISLISFNSTQAQTNSRMPSPWSGINQLWAKERGEIKLPQEEQEWFCPG